MGIEIIKLNSAGEDIPEMQATQLADVQFSTHHVATPQMSIWVMTTKPGLDVMPWYHYKGAFDQDIERLNTLWAVNSGQSLFDSLFLSSLKKAFPHNLYVIFPGNIRQENWEKLPESARSTYNRGQGCVYRLEGAFQKRLAINWVPFYQPQSMVKDPAMESFWRLFNAARSEDATNSLSFFSLSDQRNLPRVVQTLMGENDKRSEQLSEIVDWYGVYSSPISPSHGTSATIYAKNRERLAAFGEIESRFKALTDQVRELMKKKPEPSTALTILSRLVSL